MWEIGGSLLIPPSLEDTVTHAGAYCGKRKLDHQALIRALTQANGLPSELVRSKPTHSFCKYPDKTIGFMTLLFVRRWKIFQF
jgi:hypothetical protein